MIVIRDDGSQVISKTRSIAWTLGHGEAVVMKDNQEAMRYHGLSRWQRNKGW
ncbi:MAG: hypothetical protein ACXAC5_02905 [Promethearchaeota archaeon]